MSEPVLAQPSPFLVQLIADRTYLWCACGRSKNQPFCDGTHVGTEIKPIRFSVAKTQEAVLCGCKRTGKPPFCDGTHNSLSDTYKRADADEISASASIPVTAPDRGDWGIAMLDGGAYVRRLHPSAEGTAMHIEPVVHEQDGAKFLSVFHAEAPRGQADVIEFAGCHVVLYISAGTGRVIISGREFDVGPEVGVLVRPTEAFAAHSTGPEPLKFLITACPAAQGPRRRADMPTNFDASVAERVHAVDESKREPMADRFYQVLIGEDGTQTEVTEFIGELPQSRAAAHRHLYEEAILILAGGGTLWTENARATVRTGDILFLPKKQLHSLECTTAGGMRLMGVFYPAGSPAINY